MGFASPTTKPLIPSQAAPSLTPSTPPDLANWRHFNTLDEEGASRATSSRRRRLWELPHKCHCPIIGVCFSALELRALMAKLVDIPRNTSDFTLHTTAVGYCESRTRAAEVLHKALEKRFTTTIKSLSALKTNAELRAAWRQAKERVTELPSSLWATWTHPACDSQLEQEVYGDIHMIQHQVGSSTRADLLTLKKLTADRLELLRCVELRQQENETLRQNQAEALRTRDLELTEVRRALAASQARESRLHRQLLQLQQHVPDLAKYDSLTRRLRDMEEAQARAKRETDEREKELARLRQFAEFAEEMLEAVAMEADGDIRCGDNDLSGKCVLCVGGRTGAISAYREAVEQSGGKFLHHDGGLEESLHRIDGALAAADIVICQAGCISHNAYWRVKDSCKRTGKPCLFVKNGSSTSFGRMIEGVTRPDSRAGE